MLRAVRGLQPVEQLIKGTRQLRDLIFIPRHDQSLPQRPARADAMRRFRRRIHRAQPRPGEEIRQHIAAGKVVTRLGLTWNERISFLFDERLQVKRLEFLDILKEEAENQGDNEEERFDLDFTLMSGELAHLLADLVEALGGEPQ